MHNKISGSLLGLVGYLLSPLSWWNDLLINMPLAYGLAYLCSLINRSLFLPAMIIGYWLTNILGFVLMHHAAKKLFSQNKSHTYSLHDFYKDLIISLGYTALVLILFQIGWLKLPDN